MEQKKRGRGNKGFKIGGGGGGGGRKLSQGVGALKGGEGWNPLMNYVSVSLLTSGIARL